MLQARRHHRVLVKETASAQKFEFDRLLPLEDAYLVDIGLGGARLTCSAAMRICVGDRLQLRTHLGGETVTVEGSVAWQRPRGETTEFGMQFEAAEPQSWHALARALHRMEHGPSVAERVSRWLRSHRPG